jgi:hypothetical protein
MDSTDLDQEWEQCWALVNTVMNRTIRGFSRRAQLHEVTYVYRNVNQGTSSSSTSRYIVRFVAWVGSVLISWLQSTVAWLS